MIGTYVFNISILNKMMLYKKMIYVFNTFIWLRHKKLVIFVNKQEAYKFE